MSHPHDNPRFAPGTILLDRYKTVRVVGAGGMGVVVHAVHLIEGTEVAIKFLLPQFASSGEAAARFVREARAATKIPSAHITRVLDTGTSPDLGPFIVMEFLAGDDLSRQIRGGLRASIAVGVDYIVQAGDAIAHAHSVGVIHRDVKPANMFVVHDPSGQTLVKVLDFGISKVLEEAPLEITKTSTLLGSGLYMSPEQMRSAKTVDHRTDIYSLGISLYELFTGTQPFTADSYPDLCIKVSMEPPVPLRRFRPDIPEELAEVIAKAYARQPADRYQSVPEFAAALSPWATPETRARIDAMVKLGKSRPPLQSGDFSSIAPPPAKLPHPGATTLPMAPRLPDLAAAHLRSVQGSHPPGPNSPGQSQSPPTLPGSAGGSIPPPPGTPAGGVAAFGSASSVPPTGAHAASSTSRAPSVASLPPPALGESSAKAFSKTAAPDSTARTVAIAAIGTFAVMSGLVVAYVMFGRGPAPTVAATSAAPVAASAENTATVPPSAPSATAKVETSAAETPTAVSADPVPTEKAAASATASAAPSAKPRVPRLKPTATPKASGTPQTSPPSDPYSCIDPVTKLRMPCH